MKFDLHPSVFRFIFIQEKNNRDVPLRIAYSVKNFK